MAIPWQCYSISVTPLIALLHFPHLKQVWFADMTLLLEAFCKVCMTGGLASRYWLFLWTLSKCLKDLVDC